MRDCGKLDLGSIAIHDQTLQLYHRSLHKKKKQCASYVNCSAMIVLRSKQLCFLSVVIKALKYIFAFYDLRLDDRAFGKFKIAFSIRCKLLDSFEFCFLYLELHCIF